MPALKASTQIQELSPEELRLVRYALEDKAQSLVERGTPKRAEPYYALLDKLSQIV
jgi:hypothetical protein